VYYIETLDGLLEREANMAFPSKDVQYIRNRLGLDYEEFAKLLGVTSRSVRRWESEGSPDKIPGSAGDILTALRFGLEKDSEKLIKFIAGGIAIGGLAFLLTKLLDRFFEGD
jgi:transcriptional regulator with XRE-family HTH domain